MSGMSKESEIRDAMRAIRDEARAEPAPSPRLAAYPESRPTERLSEISTGERRSPPHSPERERLNQSWAVSRLSGERGGSTRGLRGGLRRLVRAIVRFGTGPTVDLQEQFNSASVQFDNELVSYVDERLDRLARNYDDVLGAHGKRMEEIDERHLILQQELIRHVHDLVERIEFVFESAEQQHLYLEGRLREMREELDSLTEEVRAHSQGPGRVTEDD